jgi:hypothetical protein
MAGLEDFEFESPSNQAPQPRFEDDDGGTLRLAVIGLVLIAAIAVGAYFVFGRRAAPAKVAGAPVAPAAAPAAKAAPEPVEHIDLPPLDQSDALVRQRIGALTANRLVATWLGTSGLVRNFVVVVDNIAHGMNPSSQLRVLKPRGQFRVATRGSQLVIDPRAYDRFSPLADAAASIDAHAAGRLYQAFAPLLQTAYDELGNQEPFDRAIERGIMSLLAVPAIDGDVRLTQNGEGIGYAYADPRLEQLTGAQKQLLRMGPKNIRIIQSQLRTFAMTIGVPASRLN